MNKKSWILEMKNMCDVIRANAKLDILKMIIHFFINIVKEADSGNVMTKFVVNNRAGA